jgi:2-keto-3-deoxy-L-rhamnonate aldolase RhmA
VSTAARRHGKSLGVLMAKPEDFDRYQELASGSSPHGSDGTLLSAGARRQMELLAAARTRSRVTS